LRQQNATLDARLTALEQALQRMLAPQQAGATNHARQSVSQAVSKIVNGCCEGLPPESFERRFPLRASPNKAE
jgi:hypothetical protein